MKKEGKQPPVQTEVIKEIIGNENNFRSIISSMAEGIVVQTSNGEIIFCNSSAEKILGLTEDQMQGKTSLDTSWQAIHEDGSTFPGEDHPAMVTLRTGEPLTNILMGVHKQDGKLTWISINSVPLFNMGETTPDGVITTFHDMTSYKIAEKELYESNILRKAIVESTSDLIWSVDPERFGLLSFNNALASYFKKSRGITIQTGYPPEILLPTAEYAKVWHGMYKRAMIEGHYTTEYLVHTGKRVLELSFNVLKQDNHIFAISVFGKDITRRKQAEEKLKKEAEQRHSIGELSQTLAMIISQFQNILDISVCTTARLIGDAAFIKLISEDGHTLQPAAFHHSRPKVASLMRPVFMSRVVKLGEGFSGKVAMNGKPMLVSVVDQDLLYEVLLPEQRNDFSQINIYSLLIVPLYTRGKLIGTFGLCRNNTESAYTFEDQLYFQEIADLVAEAIYRSRTHSALIASEERYRTLVENMNELVMEADVDGHITYVSPNVINILGYKPEEGLGRSVLDLVHPDDIAIVMKSIEEGWTTGKTTVIYRLKHKNGEWRWMECAGSAYLGGDSTKRGIMVIRDITKRVIPNP